MIKVLIPFVSSGVGGATMSAAEMALRLVVSGEAEPAFVVPGPGPATDVFQRTGSEVLIIGDSGSAQTSLLPPTNSFRQKLRALPTWFGQFAEAKRVIRSHEPHILHLNEDRLVIPWAWAARSLRVPVVWHIRQERPNPQLDPIRLRLSDHLIFVSNANRSRFGLNTRLPESSLIYNVVDMARFHPPADKRAAKEGLGLHPDKLTLTFLGNLLERKRPHWVLEAASELQRQHPLQVLLIGAPFGGEGYVARLQELAAAAPRPEDIQFLSFRSDVPDLLRASDIVTLPSVPQGEAFPRAIIEAMAAGVPTLATRVAGVAEAVTHGETGLLVEPADLEGYKAELGRLLANEGLRATLGARARAVALERFSGEGMAAELLELYHHLLSRS